VTDLLQTPPTKITADDIRAAMLKRWGATASNGRTSVLFEVGNSTGFSRNRSADALIMWCWPSDGLELHGVEIKVARSDWRSELAQPKKADDIAKYCDRWWLVTSPGVVKEADELPPTWGWRVFDGRAWRTEKDAAQTPASPIDRGFLGSVLRNAGRASEGIVEQARRKARDDIHDEIERRVTDRLRQRTPDKTAELLSRVEDFQAATGILLHDPSTYAWLASDHGQRVGRMVAAMKASGVDGSEWKPGSLKQLANQLRESLKAVNAVSAEFGVEVEPEKKRGRRS
jgi:hypothetical protein